MRKCTNPACITGRDVDDDLCLVCLGTGVLKGMPEYQLFKSVPKLVPLITCGSQPYPKATD